MVAAVWIICLLGVAAASRMHAALPHLTFMNDLQSGQNDAGPQDCTEPPAAPPQVREAAVSPAIPLPSQVAPPEPPMIGPPPGNSASSPVLPPPTDATVARSAPSAGLLPPIATAEPPLLETASAKQPTRADNVGKPEPLQAAPPRTFSEPGPTLCLWAGAAGKVKRPPRAVKRKDAGPLVGTFSATLDEHKGLVLPEKAAEQMGSPQHVYVTPGPDDSVWLCNAAALEKLAETLAPDARRLYYAQTGRIEVDRSGRIVLPESLGSVGCMRPDVVLIGAGDHFELWDAQRLQLYVDRNATKK
jgi:MraZ protein